MGIYKNITDTYFSLDPFLRIREATQTYPVKRLIQRKGFKRIVDDGIVEEAEIDIPNAKTAIFSLADKMGNPEVIVEGSRKAFSYNGLTACVDKVDFLGDYTEMEKVTNSKEENSQALREVVEALKSLGVRESQITSELYPTMLYKKFNAKII